MTLPVQPFPWEAVLLALFLLLFWLAWGRIRRRRAFAPLAAVAAFPQLATEQRVTGTVRRTLRDPNQGVWLITVDVNRSRFTFCATDYERQSERYESLLGKKADIALFALATLAPGGVEAMKHQIKNIDKIEMRPDLVTLTQAGEFPNDYAVIARVLSARHDAWEEMALTVYRAQVVRQNDLTLVIDLAVAENSAAVFAPQTMVHGSARLFGYLAS